MAKRKTTKKRKKQSAAPQHMLPAGFWAQAGAVFLVVVSILLMVSWFSAGGPILDSISEAIFSVIGFAIYVVPLLFLYTAIEIFRADENRIPFLFKLALVLLVIWIAGFFDLLGTGSLEVDGGYIGGLINKMTLAMVNIGVGIFIYLFLIAITSLFLLRVAPQDVLAKIWDSIKEGLTEGDTGLRPLKEPKLAKSDKRGRIQKEAVVPPRQDPIIDLPVSGVPTVEDDMGAEKGSSRSSLKGATPQDKVAEEQTALVTISDPNWQAPSVDLLEKKQSPADPGDVHQNAQKIRDTLAEFNIEVEMEGANVGPKVTQYTLKPPSGVKLNRISALESSIMLSLAAKALRIEAPIPGKSAVGIEVPNKRAADVRLHGILTSKQWRSSRQPLTFAVGKDITGEAVVGELNKMPHLLIAGQTGSGKSVMINTLLTSLLYRNSPSDMKLILIDPKGGAEMQFYDEIPHLLTPVISEPEKTISALKWAVNEMERRYKMVREAKVRDIASYNEKLKKSGKKIAIADEDGIEHEHEDGQMPYIVIVVDELADLMMTAPRDVEALIIRLTQKARAVGIHMVLATQRPSVNVITGSIKINVPARIAFTVSQQVDSRTILDSGGAEKLLGQGDMLMKTADMGKPKRIQGAWVMDEEVVRVTDYLRDQSKPQYNEEIISQPVQINAKGGMVMDIDGSGDDEFKDAVRVVVESRKASTSFLQRKLRIGYSKAARIMEEMEEQGIIGPADGSRPREVLVSDVEDLG